MTTTPIRIIVADDHILFRQGLIEMLRTMPEFDVVADGGSGHDAISLAETHEPDVAILDVGMPGPGPVETIRRIRQSSPGTKIVIVTMFDEPRTISELISAGVVGYLLKSSDRAELSAAVHAATRGEDMVMVSITRQAFLGLRRSSAPMADVLSQREEQVLHLLADAKSNQDIGQELHISLATVKRHLSNIYAKLGATTRADAVRTARKVGLVTD